MIFALSIERKKIKQDQQQSGYGQIADDTDIKFEVVVNKQLFEIATKYTSWSFGVTMSALLSIIMENGVYILPCIVIFIAILVVAVSNAEKCLYPAECFDCDKPSCRECAHLF